MNETSGDPAVTSRPEEREIRVPHIVGVFAIVVGLLLVNIAFLAFAVPSMALTLLLWALVGEGGIWLGSLLISPIWIWILFRFFLPVTWQIIWIDGRPALFALDRTTPERMVGVVTTHFQTLRSDANEFRVRIGKWLNA